MTSPRALQLEQRALHAMHQSESLPAGWQLPRATFLSKTSYYATDQRNARGFAIFSYRAVSIRGLAPGSVFDYQQSSVLAESTAGCQSRLRQSIFRFNPFSASLSAQPAPALFELLGHAVCPNSSKSFMFHPETDNSGK